MPFVPAPSVLTFNELNGEECREVLLNRCVQAFEKIPYFQKHITLPRVKMVLNVRLEIWADQPNPEQINIGDTLTVVLDQPILGEVFNIEATDAAAPIPGGKPPDQVREMHGLPVSAQQRGPREVGGHIAVSDQFSLDGREVEGMPGLKISRTGSGSIDGMPTSANATVAKMDTGPAGLRAGQLNREAWSFPAKRRP